jgi:hypothetical protein
LVYLIENILRRISNVQRKLVLVFIIQLQPLKVIDWKQKEHTLKKMRVAVNDIIIFCQKNNINKDINEIAIAIVDLLKSAPLLYWDCHIRQFKSKSIGTCEEANWYLMHMYSSKYWEEIFPFEETP